MPRERYSGYDGENRNVERVVYLLGRVQISGKKAEKGMELRYIPFLKSILDTAGVLEKIL